MVYNDKLIDRLKNNKNRACYSEVLYDHNVVRVYKDAEIYDNLPTTQEELDEIIKQKCSFLDAMYGDTVKEPIQYRIAYKQNSTKLSLHIIIYNVTTDRNSLHDLCKVDFGDKMIATP